MKPNGGLTSYAEINSQWTKKCIYTNKNIKELKTYEAVPSRRNMRHVGDFKFSSGHILKKKESKKKLVTYFNM